MKRSKQDPFLLELKNSKLVRYKCDKESCPFYGECNQVPTEIVGGATKIKYLFVDAFGTEVEAMHDRPFTNRSGMTLRNMVFYLKKERDIQIDYGVHHLMRHGMSAKTRHSVKHELPDAMDYCKEALKKVIKKYKPDVIIALGRRATEFFNGSRLTLDSVHGTFLRRTFYGTKVFATFDTTYGFSNPDILGEIYKDIAYLFGKPRPKITVTYGKNKDRYYKIIDTVAGAKKYLKKLKRSTAPVVLDTETANLYKFHNTLLTIQFYNGGEFGYCLPIRHPESPFSEKDLKQIAIALQDFLNPDSSYPFIVGHNLKFDYTILLCNLGVVMNVVLFDTLAGAFLLDETHTREEDEAEEAGTKLGGYSLGSQIRLFDYREEWYFSAKNNRGNLLNESLAYVAEYGVGDVVLNWEVFRCQLEEAREQGYSNKWRNLLISFYSPQIKLFAHMEINGILIDTKYLKVLMDKENSPILKHIDKLLEELKTLDNVKKANKQLTQYQTSIFGDVWLFDISKIDHKLKLFFDIMDLKPLGYGKPKKDGSRDPSMNSKFKKEYKLIHREVGIFAELTRANQLFGLYCKSFYEILRKNKDCTDGRIRPSFFGTRTRTGRGSSAKPNVQQTVRETEDDPLATIIRGLFTSRKGKVIVKLDLMANEVRGWGFISNDPVLTQSVLHGKKLREDYFVAPTKALLKRIKTEGDLHYSNASAFYEIPIEKVTKDERQDSKTLTFGNVYGLTIKSMAASLKKTEERVKEIVTIFFKTFKKGKIWLNKIARLGKKNLYAESPIGRRRRLWQYLVQNKLHPKSTMSKPRLDYEGFVRGMHAAADRRAQNSPIQSVCSDLAFIGAFLVLQWIQKNCKDKDWLLLNVVHDSLETEIPIEDLVEFVLLTKVIFERQVVKYVKKHFHYTITIPVEVDYEVGFSLNKLTKWDGAYTSLHTLQAKLQTDNKTRKDNKDADNQ
jgi:uracil-DNA glycosylase family 4